MNSELHIRLASIVLKCFQSRLFAQFFVSFARTFGCTKPPAPPASSAAKGPLNLAYIHKYMNLNYTQLGHFINQLTLATKHFGFSDQDSRTFNTRLNSLFNVRCAPAITLNPGGTPQLLSLCQNPTCPLAAPAADCNAYVNLTADGIPAGGFATTLTAVPTATYLSTASSAAPTTTSTASSSASAAPAAGGSSLSTGAIAGIAVGGAAVVGIFLLAFILLRRRRRPSSSQDPQGPPPPPSTYTETPVPQYSYPTGKDQHASYVSNVTAPTQMSEMGSEMGSPRYMSPAPGYPGSPHSGHAQHAWPGMEQEPIHELGGGWEGRAEMAESPPLQQPQHPQQHWEGRS